MKVGLVLEGGAMRGMYTAGVLDVMMDHGVRFDCIVGVSAGALFGVNYLSGQRGRVIRYNKRFNHERRYLGLWPLLHEGNIVNTEYAYGDVPHRLDPFDDETFRASGVPFYAGLTEYPTGRPAYIRVESVFEQMDVLRASGSMPFVSRPVEYKSRLYLDGGISDSVPVRFARSLGCEKLVVVLTRDESYREAPLNRALIRLRYGSSPIAKLLLRHHDDYNSALAKVRELGRTGAAAVITPSEPITIPRIEKDPEALQSVYELGLRDGAANIERIIQYISE